jgi:non-specific serine/threonine protein kinase
VSDPESQIDLGIEGLGPAEHIGRGGFADVYRAEQLSLRRTVAVKVLRSQASGADTESRFRRECHAIGAVSDHPYIVGVHEGGFTRNGRAYLVMEYLPGGSLADRVRDDGPMPVDEIVDTGIKIGKALSVAHRTGVLHRDVKPANIMISAYGEPALGDFGIARIEGGPQTASGLVTASLAHVAPEVLGGEQPTPAADIYSLASTMFELLTGRPPYYDPTDETIWPLMKRILSEPFPSPESVGLSAALGAVFNRSTSRTLAGRYRSAEEMVEDLSELASDPMALTRYPGTDTRLTSLPGRTEDGPLSRGLAKEQPAVDAPPLGGPPPATRPDLTSLDHMAETRAAVPGVGPAEPARLEFEAAGDDATSVITSAAAAPPTRAMPAGGPAGLPPASPPRRRRSPLLAVAAVVLAAVAAGSWLFRDRISDLIGSGGSSATLAIPDAELGPLTAGQTYPVDSAGVLPGSTVRVMVDGVAQGVPRDPADVIIEAEAGQHRVALEITSGQDVSVTDEVTYLAEDASGPTAGYRAVLATIDRSAGWEAALRAGRALSDDGHQNVEFVSSDNYPELTPGRWLLTIGGFGQDSAAAEAAEQYCEAAELAVPLRCYAAGLGLAGG